MQFMKFTPDGKLLQTIGDEGRALRYRRAGRRLQFGRVEEGHAWRRPVQPADRHRLRADGSMFMSDGYGNARVHKFSADAKYLFSWGEPGKAPGQFNLPHGVWIDRRGRLLVADRENDRVQVFDQDGKLLEVWPTELIGPAFFYVDPRRHRLCRRAQRRHDQHPDARWRAAGALGRSRSIAPATASGAIRTATSMSCSRANGAAFDAW